MIYQAQAGMGQTMHPYLQRAVPLVRARRIDHPMVAGFGSYANYPVSLGDQVTDMATDTPAGPVSTPVVQVESAAAGAATALWGLLSVVGMGAGAYHGYKRNESIGWAIAWGLLGGIFPIITLPVSFAQGFGKRK